MELKNIENDKTTNQVIHEWLTGECRHEWDYTNEPYSMECTICGKVGVCYADELPYPDYESDLNAVREAEDRIYSTAGLAVTYIDLLKTEVRRNYSTSTIDDWHDWFKVATADAKTRSLAIRRLIEGK